MAADPMTTFLTYLIGILFVCTVMAALAEWLDARAARKSRDQARAEVRAQRQREREIFDF